MSSINWGNVFTESTILNKNIGTQPDAIKIETHFEHIELAINKYLNESDGAKICAAWFSSHNIFQQLGVMGEIGLIIGANEKITPGNAEYNSAWVHSLLRDLPDMVYVYQYAITNKMMHNKFIILLRENQPYAVITGSFNYTFNASNNWENIVYIESESVATSYLDEYNKILTHCMPLRKYIKC